MRLSSSIFKARVFLVLLSGLAFLMALLGPSLAAAGHVLLSALVYGVFSPICHQMPERSFELLGFPWAVCHRCSGIYLGVLFAAIFYTAIPRRLTSDETRRYWVVAATAPLVVDVGLTAAGVWDNVPLSRLCTGFLFGAMLSSLLVLALSELFEPWNLPRCNTAQTQGGAC